MCGRGADATPPGARRIAPHLRGSVRQPLAAKTASLTLIISRPAQDQAGEKMTIAIQAFDDSDTAAERGLIADVPPQDIRQAIIGLSPDLFRFLCRYFGDER